MKLLSCQVENFGKLSGFSYIFEDDLNVFLAENGWGKSTLAAFLKVMFYGFDGENRRTEDGNERLRYRPWGGGAYGGTVTFSRGERVYRMHRSFGMRGKEDVFLLFDDATGLPSSDFTDNIGEELFGIDRASFTRTVFWSQQDHMTEATTMIQAKIGDLTAEQSDLPDYDRAIRKVQREIERLSPDRASGQIRKKEARAAVLEADSARLPQLTRQLTESATEQQILEAELNAVRKERQEWIAESARHRIPEEEPDSVRKDRSERMVESAAGQEPSKADAERAALVSRLEISRSRLEKLHEIRRSTAIAGHRKREEYLRIQSERAGEEQAASLDHSRQIRTLRAITASALVAAVFFLFLVGIGILPVPFAAIGALLLIGGLYSAFRRVHADSTERPDTPALENLRDKESALRISLEDLSRRMKQAEAQIREEEKAQRSLKARIERLAADNTGSSVGTSSAATGTISTTADSANAADPEGTKSCQLQSGTSAPEAGSLYATELAGFDRREEDCRRRLARAERETEDLRRQIRECHDAADQLQILREELTTLRRQYETCVKTASFLEEARSSFNSRYMNPFLRSFRRHYGMLTGESAEDLQTDADFGITVLSEGLPRDPSLMSEGTRDLISLCRRMAMIDAMYPGEKPFLVLDDPFSNLDDERVKGGMRFLRDASLEYQILYLTCHASRA